MPIPTEAVITVLVIFLSCHNFEVSTNLIWSEPNVLVFFNLNADIRCSGHEDSVFTPEQDNHKTTTKNVKPVHFYDAIHTRSGIDKTNMARQSGAQRSGGGGGMGQSVIFYFTR